MPKAEDKTLQQRIAELEAENAALKAGGGPVTIEVSPKGAVLVRGCTGRFPATYYQEQWLKIFEAKDQILAFIEANKSKLKSKGDSK